MMFKKFCVLLFCIIVTESKKDAYEYASSVGRFIKLHRIPENWQGARSRCHLEGGILASPESQHMLAAMQHKMGETNIEYVYIGIHDTFSKGDYTTLTGTPLSELDVEWQRGEPNNENNVEDCLVIDSMGRLADVECTKNYPFLCHKSVTKMYAHTCSYPQDDNVHSDYIAYNETGSCYKYHREGRTWHDAFRICQAEDAHLAVINSEKESEFIRDQLFTRNLSEDIPGDFPKDAASVGFKQWFSKEWYTIHGVPLTESGFSTFNPGEPNNSGKNETCGSVWRTGLLNDHNCDRGIAFICEKPIISKVHIRVGEDN